MSIYPLRLAGPVMEEARQAAAEDNVSLDQLFSAFIADGLGRRRAMLASGTEQCAAALAILDRAPDVAPDRGDEREG